MHTHDRDRLWLDIPLGCVRQQLASPVLGGAGKGPLVSGTCRRLGKEGGLGAPITNQAGRE